MTMARTAIAAAGSLVWNIFLVRVLADAAAPPPCAFGCDHVGAGSSITRVQLVGVYGASGGAYRPSVQLSPGAVKSFDPTPYVLPPRPVGAYCDVYCTRTAPAATEASCPDDWVGHPPRIVLAPKPAGVATGTSDDPRAIVACVLVTWSGRAAEAYLVRNGGANALARRVPLAIRNQWLFAPARRNGEAVASWARVRINPEVHLPPGFDAVPPN